MCDLFGLLQFLHSVKLTAKLIDALLVFFLPLLCLLFGSPAIMTPFSRNLQIPNYNFQRFDYWLLYLGYSSSRASHLEPDFVILPVIGGICQALSHFLKSRMLYFSFFLRALDLKNQLF